MYATRGPTGGSSNADIARSIHAGHVLKMSKPCPTPGSASLEECGGSRYVCVELLFRSVLGLGLIVANDDCSRNIWLTIEAKPIQHLHIQRRLQTKSHQGSKHLSGDWHEMQHPRLGPRERFPETDMRMACPSKNAKTRRPMFPLVATIVKSPLVINLPEITYPCTGARPNHHS